MKRVRKTLALLLAVLTVLPLAACAQSGGEAETTAPAVTDTAAVTETTELLRENTPDNLPDDLDFDGRTFRFAVRDNPDYTVDISCEANGDVVNDAIFDRNLAVSERLDIGIEAIAVASDPAGFLNNVKTSIQAASDDYDVIAGVQHVSLPLAVQNCYLNLMDQPHIDLDQPWWWNEYIDELRLGDKAYYFLNGDINLFGIKAMSAMFFNKRLLLDIGMEYDELYKIVLDGDWTYEKLTELSTAAYRDVNGDGVRDTGDVYGFLARVNTEPDHFFYTSGIRLTERDENFYPVLNLNTELHHTVMQTMYSLYYESDALLVTGDESLMISKFNEGTSLFLTNRFVALKNLREMEDAYGIIPFPKISAEQERYQALLHDNTAIYSVPVVAQKTDEICAVLEAMSAQNYRTVIPAFYETALKVKYQSDSTAGQIIDMIKAGAHTDFAYAYNYALNNIGLLCRTMIGAKTAALSTYLAKLDAPAQKKLAELIESFEDVD
ncbi:MAG: hypothetical protein IJD06_08780 [Clostridia bacterium]|nr:hypothetical protein [Clostridia bacterium]